jgi:protein AATF/BFR2
LCSKSKLRKSDQIALGPEYSGSQVSRKAILDGHDENDEEKPEYGSPRGFDATSEDAEDEITEFADPDAIEIDVDDEDRDIDSDNAFGESDMEKFEGFTFRGSSKPRASNGKKQRATAADFMSDSDDEEAPINGSGSDSGETDVDILDVSEQHSNDLEDKDGDLSRDTSGDDSADYSEDRSKSSGEEETGDESESSSENDDEKARRVELRKIMGEEQKTVIATISQAAKVDADKGNAVKEQRKAFDSLLSVRMILQKALISTNSMAAVGEKEMDDIGNQPYEAAEEAAINLWNILDDLRHELSKASSGASIGQKRKRDVETPKPSTLLWERMQTSEVSAIDNRQTILEKWSAKVRGNASLPVARKLNPTAPQQSITSLIQDQLANPEHLVKRTKMPRSCAPIQRDLNITEDPDIYDDGNFYQMLLKELVDQRRIESLITAAVGSDGGKEMQWTSVKEAKTRKNVDTKASKGRKMRFTVHEKLQNFMAPENRGSWEPDAIERFFRTLLGQKITLGEEDASDGGEGEVGVSLEDEGLVLFRS